MCCVAFFFFTENIIAFSFLFELDEFRCDLLKLNSNAQVGCSYSPKKILKF